MRHLSVLALPFMLFGCAVPAGISAAGYIADGMSAGASGKTVNDHMVSQLVNMDCGLMRWLDGEWVCRDRGIDPDDDTLYPADGSQHDGPPRPWGTSAEPNLQYEHDADYDAREWASGADLALVDVGDDASGEIVTAIYASPDTYVGPAEIGDLSEQREAEEKARAAEGVADLPAQPVDAAASDNTIQIASAPRPEAISARSANAMGNSVYGHPQRPAGADTTQRAHIAHENEEPITVVLSVTTPPVVADHLAPIMPQPRPSNTKVADVGSVPDTPRPRPNDLRHAADDSVPPTPRLRPHDLQMARAGVIGKFDSAQPESTDEVYLVVGSFSERQNAMDMVAQRPNVRIMVVESTITGKTRHRLVTGPYAADRLDFIRDNLDAAGIGDSWKISLCRPTSAKNMNCLPEAAAVRLRVDKAKVQIQTATLHD